VAAEGDGDGSARALIPERPTIADLGVIASLLDAVERAGAGRLD
jgi:hypothetical protein